VHSSACLLALLALGASSQAVTALLRLQLSNSSLFGVAVAAPACLLPAGFG
jgi:hypothetical protein